MWSVLYAKLWSARAVLSLYGMFECSCCDQNCSTAFHIKNNPYDILSSNKCKSSECCVYIVGLPCMHGVHEHEVLGLYAWHVRV